MADLVCWFYKTKLYRTYYNIFVPGPLDNERGVNKKLANRDTASGLSLAIGMSVFMYAAIILHDFGNAISSYVCLTLAVYCMIRLSILSKKHK